MSWTAPRTWVVGEIVTAALMNTHIKDNLRYLKGLDGIPTIQSGLIIDNTDGDEYLALPPLSAAECATVLNSGGKTALDEQTLRIKFHDGVSLQTICTYDDVDDTPVNGATTYPVSSNWAYDFINTLTTQGDLPYATAAGVWARLGIGTDGYYLKVSGTSPAWAEDVGKAYAAGDVLLKYADTQAASPPENYTKYKEISVPDGGTLRIKFDLKGSDGTHGIYGRVYRNGVAVGTEQSDITGSFVTKSEDIAGWSTGDLCQLYIKYLTATSAASEWRNFRIYAASNKSDWVVNLDT